MTPSRLNKLVLEDHLGCFGHFGMEDPVCRQHCALRIRCAIERDNKVRMEIFEELVAGEDYLLRGK